MGRTLDRATTALALSLRLVAILVVKQPEWSVAEVQDYVSDFLIQSVLLIRQPPRGRRLRAVSPLI